MATDVAARLKNLGEEEAEEHWKELLDKFKHYTEGEDCILWAEALRLFVQKTLSYVSDNDAESIISTLSPIASDACGATLKSLEKWTMEEEVLESLHAPSAALSFLATCVAAAEQRAWRSSALLTPLLRHTLRVLDAVYGHCQLSGQVYGDSLAAVEKPLTGVFREAAALQERLQQLADSLAGDQHCSEECESLLVEVCDGLAAVGCQLALLDARAMASAWKCVLRLLQLRPVLVERARLRLDWLCRQVAEALARIHRLAQAKAGSEEARSRVKALKLAAFQLRLVAGLCESYGPACRAAAPTLPQLVLTLLRFTPPDPHVAAMPAPLLGQLGSQLTVAAAPLLTSLLTHARDHLQPLLAALAAPTETELDCGGLARLRCCAALAVQCVAADAACTMGGRLLEVSLQAADRWSEELVCAAPLPPDGTSLYQHLLASLSALVGSLTAEGLRTAETPLWRHLCAGGHWSRLMAADLICFLARYGPAQLCLHYCRLCQQLLERRSCRAVHRLLRRLLPLLSAADRLRELPQLPAALQLRCGAPERLLQLLKPGRQLSPQDMSEVAAALAALDPPVVTSLGDGAAARLAARLTPQLCTAAVPGTSAAARRLATATLTAASSLVTYLTEQQLDALLSLADSWLKRSDSVSVRLAAACLLESLGSHQFQRPADAAGPAQRVPALFRHLLADARPPVRQRALDAFAAFAAATPHATLVPATVSRAGDASPPLSAAVAAHLRQLQQPPRGAAQLSGRLAESRAAWCCGGEAAVVLAAGNQRAEATTAPPSGVGRLQVEPPSDTGAIISRMDGHLRRLRAAGAEVAPALADLERRLAALAEAHCSTEHT